MEKIPYENYIKALIAGRMTNKEISKDLTKHNMSLPSHKYVTELRGQMRKTQQDYFDKKVDEPEQNWLENQQVKRMVGHKFNVSISDSIEHMDGVFRLLLDPKLYKSITTLVMGSMPNEDIELVLNGKYDLELTSDHVDDFIHYFFNLNNWSHHDKVHFVNRIKSKDLKRYYKMALTEDIDFVLWELDLDPQKEYDQMLKSMAGDCFFNFKKSANRNPNDSIKWGKLFIKVSDKLEEYDEQMQKESDKEQATKDLFSAIRKPKNNDKNNKTDEDNIEIHKQDESDEPEIKSLEDLN